MLLKDRLEFVRLYKIGYKPGIRLRQITRICFLVLLPSFDIILTILTEPYYYRSVVDQIHLILSKLYI